MIDVYTIAFWASIIGVCAGGALGLLGVWIEDFWKDELGFRLIMTDVILTVTAVAVTGITFFLGK